MKEGDDLMAATRYGIMMLRFASTKALYDKFRRPIEYTRPSCYPATYKGDELASSHGSAPSEGPQRITSVAAVCRADVCFGSKATSHQVRVMSALPPKADID